MRKLTPALALLATLAVVPAPAQAGVASSIRKAYDTVRQPHAEMSAIRKAGLTGAYKTALSQQKSQNPPHSWKDIAVETGMFGALTSALPIFLGIEGSLISSTATPSDLFRTMQGAAVIGASAATAAALGGQVRQRVVHSRALAKAARQQVIEANHLMVR